MSENKDFQAGFTWIGKSWAQVDGLAKAKGETVYADDMFLPRMLFAKMLRSPHPHARIKSIDLTQALKRPGVVAAMTGKDLPIPFGILPVSQDEESLCVDKVRMIGDPVAAVAAIDEETAESALEDIVVEYELLPSVLTIEDGLKSLEETEISKTQIHEYADSGNIHKQVALNLATSKPDLQKQTIYVKNFFITKATRICRWNNTLPSLNTEPMDGSRFGLPRKLRTMFTVLWPKFWKCRPVKFV